MVAEMIGAADGHDEESAARLLRSFREYLEHERGLAPATIAGYRFVIRRFLAECFGTGLARPEALASTDISWFRLHHGRAARAPQLAAAPEGGP